MLLKSGTYWSKQWNETILPAIKDGRIIQISSTKKAFRRPFQLFVGVLEEQDRQFAVTAWGFTNNQPHVHVELISAKKV
jgi:hypothetical protein